MTFSTDDGSIYLLYMFVALPILIIYPLVVRTISRLRLRQISRAQTIVTMYESPGNLTPAEIGYMYDAALNTRECVATVFDLEYKDYIQIDANGGLSLNMASPQTDSLKGHENFIMQRVGDGSYVSILGDLSIIDSQLFNHEVSNSLVSRGLIQEKFYLRVLIGVLRAIRNVFFFYSLLIIITIGSLLYTTSLSISEVLVMCAFMLVGFTLIFAPLYIVLGVILTFIYIKLDGMRWIGTKRLRHTWPAIEGYRIYIKQAQLDKLNFASEELRIKALEKDLSYAVALGMKVDWKSRFDNH
ncbi:MAG: hypothetical protein JWM07_582 [Candidatus Saccharibacteria bacterium]|nr:hypothetical protein [Candidatus Saccharibacteria bacterium]